ncbi:MAG: PDDEXK nuclease domain-containing protein [Thermodesulfobacteriota bacterium]
MQGDQPTIGLLLCKSKKELVVEYALRCLKIPMGVSEHIAGWFQPE